MRRSQLPGCLPFFDRTLFSLVYGSAPFPEWGPSQCLSTETQREQGDALSHQGKLMPVILLLPPQPVSVPGSQKALNTTGLRKHCFSWRLCTIVSVSCLLWEAAFLDSYCLQNGIQYLLNSFFQDAAFSRPWPSYVLIITSFTGVTNAPSQS